MATERNGVVLMEIIEKNGYTRATGERHYVLPGKTRDQTIDALVGADFELLEDLPMGPYVEFVQVKDEDEVVVEGEMTIYHLPDKTSDQTSVALLGAGFGPASQLLLS